MKRSEMIEVIRTAVSEWIGCGCTIEDGDYILNKIEAKGMLPPTIELSACGSIMTTKELLDYSEIDYYVK